ncbi:MAG: PA0069 family radical SAM protein [Pirellulales bacterium]|nr:PA0069 family radical SAM protein [Pirellulales bacterium]
MGRSPAEPGRKGRGSHINPPNRFLPTRLEPDLEHLEHDEDALAGSGKAETQYLPDQSQSIVTQNDSPDIPFRYSINPYRGCQHGCSYCYARPTHEYLGFSAGLDFETKILVKHDAPRLLREFLARPAWDAQTIVFSGVTDCYQPAERDFRLTRQCLEVALEARQPVSIVTKNALVLRDLDLLGEMTSLAIVQVYVSMTTLDPELARTMEPRTSTPAARLRAVRALAEAGVPVGAMISPVIPGLTDHEIPAILASAAEAGARTACHVLLRLPATVQSVFLEWLDRTRPASRARIESLIRSTRDGKLNSAEFGRRLQGTGEMAEQIASLFRTFARKHGLDDDLPPHRRDQFRPPRLPGGQLRLFE